MADDPVRTDQSGRAAGSADAAPDARAAGSAANHAGQRAGRAHDRAGYHRHERDRTCGRPLVVFMDEDEAKLPKLALRGLAAELDAVDKRVRNIEAETLGRHKENEASRWFANIPGIDPITASAIVATITYPTQFQSAPQFAASIGLVPRQNSSGGKQRRGGISKQGDRTLRRLLVLGATAVIRDTRTKTTADTAWLRAVLERRPARLASVAQGNKRARIVWAVLVRGGKYRAPATVQAAAA